MPLAVLQARMSSRRLPGKVLADLAGAPMVLRQIERLNRARRLGTIVVATSDQASDDVLAACLDKAGVAVFRGSLDDVLARFIGAIDAFGATGTVVRLTADCPLADPAVIDETLALHTASGADYTSNTPARRSFPKGLDVEVFEATALRAAADETTDPYDREHVTPFLYRRPERFRIAGLEQAADEGEVRWTVDRHDDLDFVRAVYAGLYAAHPAFTSDDVRAFVRERPDLALLGGDRRI
ncbi:MAG: glycosyltransferase family protein [Caulobacter sp.]|nr:glycosyltransferase family protein [Caulobacter sp.]MBW8892332.1 glycosyltransferase family protein [Burkholderiales bacterium]